MQPGDQEAPEARAIAARRLIALAAESPAPLLLYSANGALLAQNDAARQTFGPVVLYELFASPERAAGILADACECDRSHGEAELITRNGVVWFFVQAWTTRDPQTGAFAVGISADDLTERRTADRAKDEFISVVNHELRTPLTAIRGAVGLLANDAYDGAAQKAELFEIAWDNCLRLGRLVDDLLDVQKLRIGAIDLVLASLEIANLARETIELLEPVAAAAGVSLRLIESAPSIVVRGDPGRLVQALSNLLSNALKHSPRGGEVTVEIVDLSPFVRVVVRDQGPGVPPSFVPKLFAPFSQADASDMRMQGGTGLGLYIVRTLIEAHGGRVGHEAPPGGGAAFYFELPATHNSIAPSSDKHRSIPPPALPR